MIYTLALIMFALWFAGLVFSYTIGGLIHILLIAAIVLFLARYIGSRKVA